MQGFLFYMIIGGIITVTRFHFAADKNSTINQFLTTCSKWPIPVQIVSFLLLSLVGLPVMLADYVMFLIHIFRNRYYNSNQVREDVYIYVHAGLLHAEAVSYSSYNRFGAQEAEEIEKTFRLAEARIVKHGFIPLTVGNFVEFYQDSKPLPQMRIKGRVYKDAKA